MATINSINTQNPIEVAKGGTGVSSPTDHGVLVGSGTGAVTVLSVGADNSLLMGNSGADPEFTTTGTPHVSSLTFDGSNIMDTYEEGTWTPAVTGGTHTAQNGYYTRIGRMVIGYGYVAWSGISGTGNIEVTGLPYTSETFSVNIAATHILNFSSASITWTPSGGSPTWTTVAGSQNDNTSKFALRGSASSTIQGSVSRSDNSGEIHVHIMYMV